MDPDGTLYIRGRSKTMILTGSGQNIYPEEIEDKLNNMYMVQESLVLEHNGRLTALVVPDFEQAELEGIDKEELPRIMENNLKELNKLLASYEQVASITVYPTNSKRHPSAASSATCTTRPCWKNRPKTTGKDRRSTQVRRNFPTETITARFRP